MATEQQKAIVFLSLMTAIVFITTLGVPLQSLAKDDNRNRQIFYGRVESMPKKLHGTWVIGGIQITTDTHTEFDQEDTPLVVGGCAKVDIRDGRIHEIDSEPARDCQELAGR